MEKVSVIIISKNEAPNIKESLKSIQWAHEIILVDSGSSDDTIIIAKEFTSKIYYRKFDNFSSQKNFAISKCSYNWIFSLDCDEVVSDALKQSILSAIKETRGYSAFRVKRINKMFGKVLHFAAGRDFPVRLFKKGDCEFVQPVHEFLEVRGEVGGLEGELLHNTTADIKTEFEKTDAYTELEAKWVLERNTRSTFLKIFLYPIAIFLKIYIFNKGLLDGYQGLMYAFVSARYVYIKYLKARRLFKSLKI